MTIAGDVWYRNEMRVIAPPVNEWDEIVGRSRAHVYSIKYSVVSVTPKGVWLLGGTLSKKRFVLLDGRKKFAHSNMEDARVSFIARKNRHIDFLSYQIRPIQEAINQSLPGELPSRDTDLHLA